MTETSTPWNGTVLGDAGPFEDDDWTDIWASLFTMNTAVQGTIGPDPLAVSTPGTVNVSVASGVAMVDGTWYRNTGAVVVAIPTPAALTRIDRIVLRKSWAAQTVRITRVAGVEGGAAPALTQVDGTTWDIPLAEVTINVAGAITISADERVHCTFADPQLHVRQGGSASVWATPGTSHYNPTSILVQSGSIAWSGGAAATGTKAVTFPTAFETAPIVVLTALGANAIIANVNDPPLTTGFTINWRDSEAANHTDLTFHWVAYGPSPVP